MLNLYKDVHCMPEANFLVFFLQKFASKQTFSAADVNAIFTEIELYSYSHPWVGWELTVESAKKSILSIIENNNRITFPELCCEIYKQFKVEGMDKSAAKMIIDKNPSFTIFVNQISKAFPESKFIWIMRDYRANILSRKQSVFLKSPNVAYNAIRWKLYNKIAYSYYKKNKDKVILVKYENLVSDPKEFEQILSFLSISPAKESETMSAVDLNKFKVEGKYKERFFKKYYDLNKTLNTDRLNSWKEQLPAKEIEVCDNLCYNIASALAYQPLSKVTVISRLKTTLANMVTIGLGYFDIFKDKVLFYFPVGFKLNRLKKKYIELGFIQK